MNIINTLGVLPWIVLASVPPLLILLYFLKLRRVPLEVPSTYLWHRTIEDLHVNSIWQRLRQSLLLFLQLLLIALLIFACLRPGWKGAKLSGGRYIFLVDTSASMSATDVEPSRLETAKARVADLIDQMNSGDVAMIISFSDGAKVEQQFTDNRSALRRKLRQIEPTNRPTNLREALRAADGLANPGRTSVRPTDDPDTIDVQVADPLPAELYIFSDGGFDPVADFALGNLTATYIKIGKEEKPGNVAIASFATERNPEKLDQQQAFARLENYGTDTVTVGVSLYLNDQLRDADEVTLEAGKGKGIQFELLDTDVLEIEEGVLRLEIQHKDDLPLDNVAYAALNMPRRANVLLLTPKNDALRFAVATEEALKIAEVLIESPEFLESDAYATASKAGVYDLIIYDQCVPKAMPQANTLSIGTRPPLEKWNFGETTGPPIIVDTDRAHPLMQLIEVGNVVIVEGFPIETPPGGTSLIDTNIGSVFAVSPREGFEDAVLGFEMFGRNENGDVVVNTDWMRQLSFPIFVQNVLSYLGGARGSLAAPSVKPGQPVKLRARSPIQQQDADKEVVRSVTVELPKRRLGPNPEMFLCLPTRMCWAFTKYEKVAARTSHIDSPSICSTAARAIFKSPQSSPSVKPTCMANRHGSRHARSSGSYC